MQCGQRDAFPGYVRCPECIEKVRLASIKCWEDPGKRIKYNTRGNERRKQLYNERKEKHLCVTCGKKLSDMYNFVMCIQCREKRKIRRRSGVLCGERFRERIEQGVCMYCGGEVVPGYKFCERHLEPVRKNARKMGVTASGTWRKEIDGQWKIAKLKGSANG